MRASDADDVWQILTAVFAGEQGIPVDWNRIPEDREPRWWCAEVDAAVVGVAAAWNEDGQVHWGRYAVRQQFRGLRIGTALARHSFEDLFSQGVERIHLDARDATVRIIRGMGGRVTGEAVPFFDGAITPMILARADYLAAQVDA